MKNIFLLVICLFSFGVVAAQPTAKELEKHRKEVERSRNKNKIVISLDTVFNKGTAYCIMKATTKGVMGMGKSYDVYDLAGTNVFFAKADLEAASYELMFLESGKKVTTPALRYLEDHIVENNIFKNGVLDEAAIRKYTLINEENKEKQAQEQEREARLAEAKAGAGQRGTVGSGRSSQSNDNESIKMVERNRTSDVSTMGSSIRQDFKEIGTFKKGHTTDGNDMVTIKSVNNKLVAEGTCQESIMCKTVSILTFKDNEVHTITLKGLDSMEEKIGEFLVKYGYL